MDEQKETMPLHIEKASNFISDLFNMNHKQQVEAFDHVRKTLIDYRKVQYEGMLKEIEQFNIDAKIQNEGTGSIASGL